MSANVIRQDVIEVSIKNKTQDKLAEIDKGFNKLKQSIAGVNMDNVANKINQGANGIKSSVGSVANDVMQA